MTTPAPGDTLGDLTLQQQVLDAFLRWQFCGDSILGVDGKWHQPDLKLGSDEILVVEDGLNLADHCGYPSLVAGEDELIRRANHSGSTRFAMLRIRVYKNYGYVRLTFVSFRPVWQRWVGTDFSGRRSGTDKYSYVGSHRYDGMRSFYQLLINVNGTWRRVLGQSYSLYVN